MHGASSGVRIEVTDFISFVNPQPTDTATLEIRSLGDAPAVINRIRFEDGILFELVTPPQFPLTINPGQTTAIAIGLKQLPQTGNYFVDTLHVHSDDPRRPDIRVGVELRR
jgi:hypothetical protein